MTARSGWPYAEPVSTLSREIPGARFATACSHLIYRRKPNIALLHAGGYDAVDGLPTWIRWIIVAVVGLSPILIFWMAGTLRRYLRRKPRARLASGSYGLRHPRRAREDQGHRGDQRR